MLNTVSDLLEALLEKEKEVLSKQKISHPGIIGDMYEGLTKEILNRAIFKGLNLSVRDGLVRGEDGKLSKQIDCMIVEGEGEQIPNTNHYIYDFENVVAIVEVKKNLYGAEISSAYDNLVSFSEQFTPSTKMNIRYSDLVQPFQEITKKEFPQNKEELKKLDIISQMIYHHLVIMYAMPLRVIFGYYGFKTEKSLRDGYYEYLTEHLQEYHYGPNSMPDLIICDNASIIKVNQQPFQIQSVDDDFFTLFVTSTKNPLYYLLMMLWYKLQFRYDLSPDMWDFNSYSFEQMKIYLLTKLVEFQKDNSIQRGLGYNYVPMTDEELENVPPEEEWEPFSISKEAFIVATNFRNTNKITNITNIGIPADKIDKIISELLKTKLFILDGNSLICNAKSLQLFMNGKHNYICDNNDGDLNIWLKNQMNHS
ncbi:MAG: hypothetical protein IK024_12785 [Treponema sp.]|nr:hypothetical protein [Treponema sp.]